MLKKQTGSIQFSSVLNTRWVSGKGRTAFMGPELTAWKVGRVLFNGKKYRMHFTFENLIKKRNHVNTFLGSSHGLRKDS